MWHTMNIVEVCEKLKTNVEKGLNDSEVKRKKEEYGENKLKEKKKENIFIKFIKQFNDFMILILIIASIISAAMAKMQGTGDYLDSIIIISIVIFNAIMGLIQESKAEKSLEALKKMSAPKATVKRNGKIFTIASEEIVPGDIVLLEAGCYVPADCRLIKSYNLKIEESALTGETVPVSKEAEILLNANIPTADKINMAFATTIVVNRTCRSSCYRNRNEYKSGNYCKINYNRRGTRNTNSKKIRRSWKNIRCCMYNNMYCYILNRNIKENTCN